ncbi:MAG: CheR family methyltransferase [Caldimonas sp.]
MNPSSSSNGSPSGLSFPVVGLGASAGGLQALIQCLESLPADPDMAFVVILHLSASHESNAAAILQRATRMPVRQVTAVTAIERNHVYVIPPTHSLSMYDGHLGLSVAEKDKGRHVAIDLFFRTLADAHRERSVGVVLSGTGSDGAVGLARIKEKGGIVIAQSPGEAEYSGMPESAIATGKVDFVLPVADIAQKLVDLWASSRRIELPADDSTGLDVLPPSAPLAAEEALRGVLAILQRKTGHDFKHYKRGTVLRRIERRLQVNAIQTLPDYRDFVEANADEARALLADMLIGVTNFFRDRESFEAFERDVVPSLLQAAAADEQIRAWVAGCSTGEEAYSFAILLSDALARARQTYQLQVFATDIDGQALASARLGRYPEAIVTDVPPAFLRDSFSAVAGGYQVSEVVRKRVLFAVHNLLRDPPFSRLDLVSCRNLLIYLDRETQKDVLQTFHFALRPGGYLFLGGSETADAASDLFEPVDRKHRIYRSVPRTRARNLPAFPLGGVAHHPERVRTPPSAKPPAKPVGIAELHQRAAFDDDATGTVVVGPDLEILHTSPGAGQFLRFAEGSPTRHLLSIVQPELRSELRLALFELSQGNERVAPPPVRVGADGQTGQVRMALQRLHGDWPAETILIRFSREPVQAATLPVAGEPVLAQMEQALQRKDEQLQSAVAQFSLTTEDLKSSNEELQALNEELRSASEELETSKEELQSTNEELITVNVELKTKVDETAQVNDDWENLLRGSEIAVVFVDSHLRIKRFTPATTAIFNLIGSDVGRSLLDITHKLDYDALVADVEETFRTLRRVEREVKSSDGRWLLARMLPYRTGEDRISGAGLTFIDISSRVFAESSMRLGEERLQLVAQSIPEFAMLTTDSEGRVASWSAGAQSLFGYSEADIQGRSLDIIFTEEDRAAGVPEEERRRASESGRSPGERWHVRKDGSRFYASGVLARLDLGKVRGFAKIAHDITELHRRQGEGAAAIDAAQAAARLKDEFLAVMSHELKHPLNLIHVNAQLLLNLPETRAIAAVRKAGENIERSVVMQARIIDDLLDLSRIKAGKLTLDLAPVELAQALEPSLRWALEQARAKGLELHYTMPSEPIYVRADAVRLEQVVMNLLSNALKFTATGGKIEVRLSEEDDAVVLEVADNGRGISPSFMPHVFAMFEQEEHGASRREGGLGIGLGLARELVELHGGRVEASSPGPGLGSTFTARLPVHERSAFVPLATAAPDTSPFAGQRILVVDDDPDAIETFAMLLRLEGADVTEALNGADALRICERATFDMIISDIGMPVMDGSQMMSRLRREPGTKHVPAIALTGYGRPQDVQSALVAGFTAHLPKPADMSKLRALAAELLSRKA